MFEHCSLFFFTLTSFAFVHFGHCDPADEFCHQGPLSTFHTLECTNDCLTVGICNDNSTCIKRKVPPDYDANNKNKLVCFTCDKKECKCQSAECVAYVEPANPNSVRSGLSDAAIVGICAVVILVLIIVLCIIAWLWYTRRHNRTTSMDHDKPTHSHSGTPPSPTQAAKK